VYTIHTRYILSCNNKTIQSTYSNSLCNKFTCVWSMFPWR